MQIIKSILRPDKIGYELSPEWQWDRKGNSPIHMNFLQFDTCGDGITKHSPSYCVQFTDFTDGCLSLAAAIVADPLNENWRKLTDVFHHFNDATIRFALSVKFKEGTDQWYSLLDHKVTKSEAKRHDRRFEKVENWHDGSALSALNILLRDKSYDWFARVLTADRVREINYELGNGFADWAELFKPTADLAGDWHAAFRSLLYCLKAVRHLDNAARCVQSCKFNSMPRPAVESEAA